MIAFLLWVALSLPIGMLVGAALRRRGEECDMAAPCPPPPVVINKNHSGNITQ